VFALSLEPLLWGTLSPARTASRSLRIDDAEHLVRVEASRRPSGPEHHADPGARVKCPTMLVDQPGQACNLPGLVTP
jgi:hypothetical protein